VRAALFFRRESNQLIKNFIFIISFVLLFGCATTIKESSQKIDQYEERSEKANQRAAEIGRHPGTPENIENIERANEESAYYREKARDEWWNSPVGLVLGLIGLLIGIAIE